MINLMNFREKTKLTEDEQQQVSDFGVIFLCDDAGNDWYESQSQFAAETIKVMYAENGVICAVSQDISKLWPLNMSVAEVQVLPDGCDTSGAWCYTNSGEVIHHHDFDLKQAKKELLNRQNQADSFISPLERAVKYGMATDEERAVLEAWERYSILLSRVDIVSAPDIEWPAKPE